MSEPVIIGGGPAGSAAAIAIARAGRAVTLIERHAAPADKVCGDFLSVEAVEILSGLGIDLSIAAPIDTVRLVHRRSMATAQLPFTALGLTRRALDAALLQQACANGATVQRGRHVRSIEPDAGSLRLDCGEHGSIRADTVFLATGKHELRGSMRAERGTGMAALKMYFALASAQRDSLRRHVELILFAGGYAGLQLVEADRAVLCVLISGQCLRAADGSWDRILDTLTEQCPHLCDRLAGAQPLLERPLAIAGLPYGYVHSSNKDDPAGLFRLGDQAAVIPSFTGDGVALALASSALAARTWLAKSSAKTYHTRLEAGLSQQMRRASALHTICLQPVIQPWLIAACQLWPGAMRIVASATRATGLTQIEPAA